MRSKGSSGTIPCEKTAKPSHAAMWPYPAAASMRQAWPSTLAAEAPEIDFIRPDFPRDGVFRRFSPPGTLFRLDRAIHGGERRDHRHRSGTLAFSLCGNTTRFHPLESGNLSRGISCLFQAGKRHPFSVRRRESFGFFGLPAGRMALRCRSPFLMRCQAITTAAFL